MTVAVLGALVDRSRSGWSRNERIGAHAETPGEGLRWIVRTAISVLSTSRGPGRLKNALPSAMKTRPGQTAGSSAKPGRAMSAGTSRSVCSMRKPQEPRARTPRWLPSPPAPWAHRRARGSVAASDADELGVRCSATIGGESHSKTTTRGRGNLPVSAGRQSSLVRRFSHLSLALPASDLIAVVPQAEAVRRPRRPALEGAFGDRALRKSLAQVQAIDEELGRLRAAPAPFRGSPVGHDLADTLAFARNAAVVDAGALARERYARALRELEGHLRDASKLLADISTATAGKLDRSALDIRLEGDKLEPR